MALRSLLSKRILTVQRTSILRSCRAYSPLMFDQRSSSYSFSNFWCPSSITTSSSLLHPTRFSSVYFQRGSFSTTSRLSSNSDSGSNAESSGGNSPTSSNDGNSSNSNNQNDESGGQSTETTVPVVIQPGNPLMSVEVPENFPIVPLIPVSRHPLFPKFIKMLEITNKDLIELIRRKVKLNQPYAGIFLRKESSSETPPKIAMPDTNKDKEKIISATTGDAIKSLDEIHHIGSFIQIHEVHDMGDRLRMIVMAHRRIKIVGIAPDDASIGDIEPRRQQVKNNGSRRRSRRKSSFRKTEQKIRINFLFS